MPVGKLEHVPLRTVWEREASNFTAWMAEHLEYLSEKLGFEISLIERERPAGAFSADIYAERDDGSTVVIENQLEKTDHSHLGQLITYVSNLDAKTAIWISSEPRTEHETAVNWLNEVAPPDTEFYLIQVQAFRIGTSDPAPLFTVIAGPSESIKERGEKKQDLAERHVKRMKFWDAFIADSRRLNLPHGNLSATKDNWLDTGAGRSGLKWSVIAKMDDGWVDLLIDRGAGREEENEAIFATLAAEKSTIEKAFGGPLVWDEEEGRRSRRIRVHCTKGGIGNEETWAALRNEMLEALPKLMSALKPQLERLKTSVT